MADSAYRPPTATDVKNLIGSSFEMGQEGANRNIRFDVMGAGAGEALIFAGAEAYGVRVDGDLGGATQHAFLKIFRHEVPERNQRNQFLASQRLATRHWLFRGVPFGFMARKQVQGIDVHGNLSFRIRDRRGRIAPSLAHLLTHGLWSYATGARIRFCGQLCCAVYGLEALGLVHGDISLGNVLIGWHEGQGEVAVLVDFDGFYHPRQPLLPLQFAGKDIRRVGAEGFQDPNLLEELDRDPANACVRCDRLALGALVFQLIVWQPWMGDQLGRYELLTTAMIRSRSPEALPEGIKNSWPQGLELLRKALAARDWSDQPEPRDWLAALGGPPIEPLVLVVSNRRMRPEFHQKVRLYSRSGDLGKVHPELAAVRFARRGDDLVLDFGWNAPVIVPLKDEPNVIPGAPWMLTAGGAVLSNFWKLELSPD